MEYKKAIYKKREVDLKATMESLGVNEAVYLAYNPQLRIGAIRTAASRKSAEGPEKFSVTETVNGTIITRTE